MGLLDDAIREHLQLKRQHGADPNEIERQEREALGAPRQAEFAATPEEGDGEPSATPEAEPAEAVAEAPETVDEPPPGADEPPAEPVEEPVMRADEPVVEAADPVDAGEEREPFDIEALDAPADEVASREPEVPPPGEPAGAPGYDEDPWLEEERDEVPAGESLDRPREDADEPGEDVLEDTPDFLQETPEHDRLWFEQRPPRDFDWDK
jgi:hypothetical protein